MFAYDDYVLFGVVWTRHESKCNWTELRGHLTATDQTALPGRQADCMWPLIRVVVLCLVPPCRLVWRRNNSPFFRVDALVEDANVSLSSNENKSRFTDTLSEKIMIYLVFWVIAGSKVVGNRRFGTTHRSRLQGSDR